MCSFSRSGRKKMKKNLFKKSNENKKKYQTSVGKNHKMISTL